MICEVFIINALSSINKIYSLFNTEALSYTQEKGYPNMKANSKKILLWLYPLAEEKRRVPEQDMEWVVQDLTAAGRRSLVRLLIEEQLIFSDELAGEKHLVISSHGQRQLEAEFPFLKFRHASWQGDWSQILFLQAPETDKSFRYLRSLLVKHLAFSLKRGVYMYPGKLPHEVQTVLDQDYRGAVAVVSVVQWEFGDGDIIIGQQAQLQSLIDIYSGISKEIQSLLGVKNREKRLPKRLKNRLFSLYDRLYQSVSRDLGIISHYYPQQSDGVAVLNELQIAMSD